MQQLVLTENFLICFFPFLSLDFSELIFKRNPKAYLNNSIDSFLFFLADFRFLTPEEEKIQIELGYEKNLNLDYFNLFCLYKKNNQVYYYEPMLDIEFQISQIDYRLLIAESFQHYFNRWGELSHGLQMDSIEKKDLLNPVCK